MADGMALVIRNALMFGYAPSKIICMGIGAVPKDEKERARRANEQLQKLQSIDEAEGETSIPATHDAIDTHKNTIAPRQRSLAEHLLRMLPSFVS